MTVPDVTSNIATTPEDTATPAVALDRVSLAFDDNVVLRNVSFTLRTGQMAILLGASGTGKSVILKLILGLMKPDSGTIHINGERIDTMTERELMRVRGNIGMLFQESALFDSLTVADNIGYRLQEESETPEDDVRRRVDEVLGFVRLGEYGERMPSELSGGQRRRVAIARAVAAHPRLLLLDDPTSGLDPITARAIEEQIVTLRDTEHVTSILVTHELPDAVYIATHEAVRDNGELTIVDATLEQAAEAQFIILRDGEIYFQGNVNELRSATDPYLLSFLTGWVPPLIDEEAVAAG